MLSREECVLLLNKYIKTPWLKLHRRESEVIMIALAKKLGEDEEKWGLAGLLHDLDFDYVDKDAKRHVVEFDNILKPMGIIKNSIINHNEMKKSIKSTPLFVPGGQSTQLIVGATPENDGKIIKLSEALYNKYSLKRVYYSAYVPVIKDNKLLPNITHPPMVREHRLYQADWLLRYYGFKANELLKNDEDNFDLNFDFVPLEVY